MFEELAKLGLNPDAKRLVLEKFMRIFLEYNENVNLISRGDAEFLYPKHIYDSLAVNLFFEKYCPSKRLKMMDAGCGGGFPSIPAAVYFDNIDITPVDSIGKKIDFVKYAADELNLKNLRPVCSRIEELNCKSSFDVCTSRAAAGLSSALEYTAPFLKTGGYAVIYKSKKADEEIKEAQNALKILNSEIIDRIEYTLPLNEMYKRELVIIRRNGRIPDIYPRKNGLAAKKPL